MTWRLWSARELDLPLTFLDSDRYTAEIYADAEDPDCYPTGVRVLKQVVDRTKHLRARPAEGGGYAVRFLPIE